MARLVNFMPNAFCRMLLAILLVFLVAIGTSAATVVVSVIVLLGLFGIHLGQGELGLVICEGLKGL